MNLSTPCYDLGKFPNVYEPSEDTFLFLDALEADAAYLKSTKPEIIAEVGSGSGVVITALYQIFGTSCAYFATDINPQCCLATTLTSKLNNSRVECLTMDLLINFKPALFDVILFNPPYVVTDSQEMSGLGLNRSWAGGNYGREIIDKLIKNLPNLLSKKGVCYMVLLKENCVNDIVEMAKVNGFESEIVIQRKIPGEHLYVYKFFRSV